MDIRGDVIHRQNVLYVQFAIAILAEDKPATFAWITLRGMGGQSLDDGFGEDQNDRNHRARWTCIPPPFPSHNRPMTAAAGVGMACKAFTSGSTRSSATARSNPPDVCASASMSCSVSDMPS